MANTVGNWKITSPVVAAQRISEASTTKNFPFGTVVRARDYGSTAYGEGEFMYVKGVASGALRAWVGIRAKAGLTTLAVASGRYELMGVLCSTLDATTKYGWAQISGRCVAKCLTQFADNGVCYLTATAGSVDDASVAGDYIMGATGRNGGTVTVGDLSGEFEINRPHTLRRTAPTG